MNRIRVGLIYGGRSGEHDVSLQTALAVIQAFDRDKYDIYPFYITKQGQWQAQAALQGEVTTVQQLIAGGSAQSDQTKPVRISAVEQQLDVRHGGPLEPLFAFMKERAQDMTAKQGSSNRLDVVFPLLHGTFGEDGTIQGLLEMVNMPYVGAGVLASAVGMDKVTMKKVLAQEGLPQCLYRYFTKREWQKEREYYIMEMETVLGYPCFVKPANLGSSVGITKASNREELIEAIDIAFQYDRKVIVEEAIDAREVEISVLGNDDPITSVVGEVVPSNEFYDYKAKYIDGTSAMIIPAEITDEQDAELRDLAIRTFKAVDASGLSRVDFFIGKQDGRIMINEINTMPGFTPFSMYPMLWKQSGKPYAELIDNLIELAMERHEEKQQLRYSFDVETE